MLKVRVSGRIPSACPAEGRALVLVDGTLNLLNPKPQTLKGLGVSCPKP